jgi:hypothetical protein
MESSVQQARWLLVPLFSVSLIFAFAGIMLSHLPLLRGSMAAPSSRGMSCAKELSSAARYTGMTRFAVATLNPQIDILPREMGQ